MSPEDIARIAGRYATAPAWDRFHVKHRLRFFPHEVLLPFLPEAGRVLDVGCGFGLLGWVLAETRPGLAYYGADIDARKIALAKNAFARHPTGSKASHFHAGDVTTWQDRPSQFTVVTILDVLLLMPLPAQRAMFDFSCRVLERAPAAALVLKILPSLRGLPRYRTWIQENIMVNVLRKTQTSGALFTSQEPALYEAWGREHGLECQEVVLPVYPPSMLLVLRHSGKRAESVP